MVSRMYLSEIVRHMLLKLVTKARFFGDNVPQKLRERRSLETRHVSGINYDTSPNLKVVANVLNEVFEGGRLAAAGVYGILKKINRASTSTVVNYGISWTKKKTVVAMDGGLFEHHHPYEKYMEGALAELVDNNGPYEVCLRLQNDGSGIGAALLAASHSRFVQVEK